MTTTKTAAEIATALNASGYNYFGDRAKAWTGDSESRIYFGRDFVRLVNGELTNSRQGKARALTIGDPALTACESVA